MIKLLKQALYTLPLIVLIGLMVAIAIPFAVELKNRLTERNEGDNVEIADMNLVNRGSTTTTGALLPPWELPSSSNRQQHDYSMLEPFSNDNMFISTNQAMYPLDWAHMMTNMMYQMMVMPMQMMVPMANYGYIANPLMLKPAMPINPYQTPMKPEEYEKWYNQQQQKNKGSN